MFAEIVKHFKRSKSDYLSILAHVQLLKSLFKLFLGLSWSYNFISTLINSNVGVCMQYCLSFLAKRFGLHFFSKPKMSSTPSWSPAPNHDSLLKGNLWDIKFKKRVGLFGKMKSMSLFSLQLWFIIQLEESSKWQMAPLRLSKRRNAHNIGTILFVQVELPNLSGDM